MGRAARSRTQPATVETNVFKGCTSAGHLDCSDNVVGNAKQCVHELMLGHRGAAETAEQVKATTANPDNLLVSPGTPHGKREPAPRPPFDCHLCDSTRAQSDTHEST